MRSLILFTLLLGGFAFCAHAAAPTSHSTVSYSQYAVSPFAQPANTPSYPPTVSALPPRAAPGYAQPAPAQPAAPAISYRSYRLVDGVDEPAQTVRPARPVQPAKPAQPPKVVGVPRGQAPAARPAQQQPTVVIVNVYGGGGGGGSYGPPQNEYAYEYAYYNPVAPVYYRPWPEYLAYGRLWAWGVPHAYYNPPYGACFYRYEYGAVGRYYRQARTNIYRNIRPSCRLP